MKTTHSSSHRLSSRLLVGLGLAALVACAALSAGCSGAGLEQVRLASGPVFGAHEEADGHEIWTFKGIPYAAPPVGDLRWKAPQPVEPWTAPRACTQFGAASPQPAMVEMFALSAGPTDEDCLYLNVWSPAGSAAERLPVMVWIHGGSFEMGSGSIALYDGRHLAAEGVVVVTINYRLGPLGFLSHPALSAEAESGVSGNYGLLDQIAALRWVQDNIAGFGGDPGNVTVFGESAGGISILDLIVSPPAEGMFDRAIVESGILLDQGFGTKMVATREQAEAAGEVFARKLSLDPSEDAAAQLRAKTTDELLAVAAELADDADTADRMLLWKPVVDGYVLPDLPTKLWLSGRYQQVSLLIGSNSDEAELFLATVAMPRAQYEAQVAKIFGDHADEAFALYPAVGARGPARAVSRMLTEVVFASTARFAAQIMSAGPAGEGPAGSGAGIAASKAGRPSVYLYEFTRAPLLGFMGAFHAAELPYVFGTLDIFAWLGVIGQTDRDLSADMVGYWTRFAATGDPNGGGAPVWPEYEQAPDLHLELGDTIGPGSGLYKEARDLADRMRRLE